MNSLVHRKITTTSDSSARTETKVIKQRIQLGSPWLQISPDLMPISPPKKDAIQMAACGTRKNLPDGQSSTAKLYTGMDTIHIPIGMTIAQII